MKNRTMCIVILAVFATVWGCATERYAENFRKGPGRTDTLAAAKKQDEALLMKKGGNDNFYRSSYMLMFPSANTFTPASGQDVAAMKEKEGDQYYISSYMLLFPNTSIDSVLRRQNEDALSKNRDRHPYYISSYMRMFPK